MTRLNRPLNRGKTIGSLAALRAKISSMAAPGRNRSFRIVIFSSLKVRYALEAAIQSCQKPLKRSAANSVYLTVCVMFL